MRKKQKINKGIGKNGGTTLNNISYFIFSSFLQVKNKKIKNKKKKVKSPGELLLNCNVCGAKIRSMQY